MLNPRLRSLQHMERATFNATTSNGKPNFDVHHRLSSSRRSTPSSAARRQVRFSTDENDTHSAPHEELTSEMINDIWYTPEELKDIKHDVRSIVCRHLHIGKTSSSYGDRNSPDDIPALQRYDPQRSEYKQRTLRYILQAQNHSSEPDFIRSVSRQFSVRARALAANQGFEDYCEVYDPLDSLLLDTTAGFAESHTMDYDDDQEQNSIDSFTKRKQEDQHRDDERTEVSKRRRLSLI